MFNYFTCPLGSFFAAARRWNMRSVIHLLLTVEEVIGSPGGYYGSGYFNTRLFLLYAM